MAVCLAIAMAIMMMPMAAMAAPGTTVYLNSSSGDDANDGLSAANAVKTLDKALELAGEGGTILLGSTVFISDDRTLEGVTISRAEGFTATMLVVSGSATLTLQNVTLDGANVANSNYLVQVSSGSTLNIGADAVLENNQHTAVYAYNATVNMTGGTIRNNKVTRCV